MRIVAMGNLMPINAHSCVEVLEAAKPFGATPYPESPMFYRYIGESNLDTKVGALYPDTVLGPQELKEGKALGVPEQNMTFVPEELQNSLEITTQIVGDGLYSNASPDA